MATTTVEAYLNKVLHRAALAALEQYAPMYTNWLTWNRFSSRRHWMHIPDVKRPELPFYKAVLTLPTMFQPGRRQFVLWFAPEDNGALLHNHPYQLYDEYIIAGGVDDLHFDLSQRGQFITRMFTAGHRNRMTRQDFHKVTQVHRPGETLVFTHGGPTRLNDWGYMDPTRGYVIHQPDEVFAQLLDAQNPDYAG